MSLLEDARRDLPSLLVNDMQERYLQAMPLLDLENFKLWYRILATHRHCKVAGIFSRLAIRDDKAQYLNHISRVLRLLHAHLEDPLLRPLGDWLRACGVNDNTPESRADYHSARRALGLAEPSAD
jgi:aminoglycoside/choline kinase family phosphotransferase